MPPSSDRLDLFGDATDGRDARLPPGWDYRAEFITDAEEATLLDFIGRLPLEEAIYKGYTAGRHVRCA